MPKSPSCSSLPSVHLDELQPPSPTPSGQNHLLLRRDGNDLGLDFCWQNLKRSFYEEGFLFSISIQLQQIKSPQRGRTSAAATSLFSPLVQKAAVYYLRV